MKMEPTCDHLILDNQLKICQMIASLLQEKIIFSQFAVEQAGQEN